jgi:hypothetical protein
MLHTCNCSGKNIVFSRDNESGINFVYVGYLHVPLMRNKISVGPAGLSRVVQPTPEVRLDVANLHCTRKDDGVVFADYNNAVDLAAGTCANGDSTVVKLLDYEYEVYNLNTIFTIDWIKMRCYRIGDCHSWRLTMTSTMATSLDYTCSYGATSLTKT